MHLIDVDDIGLEAAKRVLELVAQPRRRGVAQELAASPVEPDLGGYDRTRSPAALERLADQLLGAAEAIARCGVDEIDAVIERGVNGVDRVAFLGATPHHSADGPGAKPDARGIEGQPCDLDMFHADSSQISSQARLKRAHASLAGLERARRRQRLVSLLSQG